MLRLECPLALLPALLPGLANGCESKIVTCLRVRCWLRGIETPARVFTGNGTPTRREVGDGDCESSLWICSSMSGIEITKWRSAFNVQRRDKDSHSHDESLCGPGECSTMEVKARKQK